MKTVDSWQPNVIGSRGSPARIVEVRAKQGQMKNVEVDIYRN